VKRLIALIFLCAGLAHGAVTATWVGGDGTNGVGVNFLIAPSYNQTAGHCIVVVANAFGQAPGTFSDTAGDTPTTAIANYVGGNTNNIVWKIFYNTAGNASNVVNVTFSNANFASLNEWDVDIGSTCTSSALDVHAAATTVTNNGGTISQTITTTSANEAIMTAVFQDNAALSAATPPTSFTANTIQGSYSRGAQRVVSAIQTGVTLSWTSILTAAANYDMATVSLKASGGGATVVKRHSLGVL
jgi:hypothetical protein